MSSRLFGQSAHQEVDVRPRVPVTRVDDILVSVMQPLGSLDRLLLGSAEEMCGIEVLASGVAALQLLHPVIAVGFRR